MLPTDKGSIDFLSGGRPSLRGGGMRHMAPRLVAAFVVAGVCYGDIGRWAREEPLLLPYSRDTEMDAHWRRPGLPMWSAFTETWSEETRGAVERALNESAIRGSGASLELPRVFVYPFPKAFEDMGPLLVAANLSESQLVGGLFAKKPTAPTRARRLNANTQARHEAAARAREEAIRNHRVSTQRCAASLLSAVGRL